MYEIITGPGLDINGGVLSVKQTDAAILNTFNLMEEGVEYLIESDYAKEINRISAENKWNTFDRAAYKLVRRGSVLSVSDCWKVDLKGKKNLLFRLHALPAWFTFALLHGAVEVAERKSCDGKVVEIDGKKYKLTAV